MIINLLLFLLIGNIYSQGVVSGIYSGLNTTISTRAFSPYRSIYRQSFNITGIPMYDTVPTWTQMNNQYGQSVFEVTFYNLRVVTTYLTESDSATTFDTVDDRNLGTYTIPGQSKVLILITIRPANLTYFFIPLTS